MNDIEEIKNRVDILDLVGQYVTLKKAGANYKGLCPFHHERSPSFMVNPERQIFKCFGCNKGGDVFTFLQDVESIEFGDALKILAARAGITLTERSKPKPGEAPSEKSRYFAINNIASQLFHKLLLEHPVAAEARDYLKKRGITDSTIRSWRIGYAPRKKVLADLLTKRGFTAKEIERAGKPDMFYDRIMFPIVDVMGNTVGFTGRILSKGEPKYLNTPETPVFRKSRILFGLEKAKQSIKDLGTVIIAEGQMDVISAHQVGTTNIVATSGTALTQDHLRILSRYDADIVFAFDADGAGVAATKKAIDMAITDGLSVKVIPIPLPHKDIGDVVLANPALWQSLAAEPVAAIEWQMNTTLSKFQKGNIPRKLSVDEKKAVAKELVPALARIPDVIEQAHYIQLLAKRLEVKEETIQQAMKKVGGPNSQPAERSAIEPKPDKTLSTAETLLGLFEVTASARAKHESLYNQLKSWYSEPISDLIFLIQEKYKGLSQAEISAEIDLLIGRYDEDQKEAVKNQFAQRIREAEAAGDRQLVKELIAEFSSLIQK